MTSQSPNWALECLDSWNIWHVSQNFPLILFASIDLIWKGRARHHYYYFHSITLLPGALMTLCLFSLPTFEFYEAHATIRRNRESRRTNHGTLQQNLKGPNWSKNYFYLFCAQAGFCRVRLALLLSLFQFSLSPTFFFISINLEKILLLLFFAQYWFGSEKFAISLTLFQIDLKKLGI